MKQSKKHTIGIIGYGAFSQFIVPLLTPYYRVLVYSRRNIQNPPIGAEVVDIDTACQADIVVLSVVVQALEAVLQQIATKLKPGSIVIDVCSVKVVPIELMRKYLPKTVHIVGTHPVFGPESGKNGITGLPIAICPVRIPSEELGNIHTFLQEELKLHVITLSPDDHDKEMAYALSLTHLVSRGLQNIAIPELRLPTQSYLLLQSVKKNLQNDSTDLFYTIQNYNPYAKKVRQNFIQHLEELEQQIEAHCK